MSTTHNPTTDPATEAAALRAEAAQHQQNAAESFERCDTDGFVSQWASGLSAQKASLQAAIVERGGVSEFMALFDLDGNWVPAKVIDGTYGQRWMVLDSEGRRTGTYLPYMPKRRNTLASKGFVEGYITRPARADFQGRGHGLSGSCWVASVPMTREWEAPASIVSVDRWADSGLNRSHRATPAPVASAAGAVPYLDTVCQGVF